MDTLREQLARQRREMREERIYHDVWRGKSKPLPVGGVRRCTGSHSPLRSVRVHYAKTH